MQQTVMMSCTFHDSQPANAECPGDFISLGTPPFANTRNFSWIAPPACQHAQQISEQIQSAICCGTVTRRFTSGRAESLLLKGHLCVPISNYLVYRVSVLCRILCCASVWRKELGQICPNVQFTSWSARLTTWSCRMLTVLAAHYRLQHHGYRHGLNALDAQRASSLRETHLRHCRTSCHAYL